MSVLIVAKFQGDAATLRRAPTERAGEFEKIATTARAAGGIHHRFGVGDGFVVVVGEWESVEHFQQFFGNPELQAFIGSANAAPAPPEILVAEAVASPDEYEPPTGAPRRICRRARRGATGGRGGCGAADTPPGGRIISGRPFYQRVPEMRAGRPGDAPPQLAVEG